MSNPLLALVEKHAGPNFLPRLKQTIFGLAEDFWKDGQMSAQPAGAGTGNKSMSLAERRARMTGHAASPQAALTANLWHAQPGEISEKMFGEGFVTPGGHEVTEMLISPLGLVKDMGVLDLSAGLGGRMRLMNEKFGVYVTGYEPDPDVAKRGMEMSVKAGKGKYAEIKAYDPASFNDTRKYDCVIIRETFYRVSDKNTFIAAIAAVTKPKAQISFTDYVIDPDSRDKTGVVGWQVFEKGAAPFTVAEMMEAWKKVGFTVRVHVDLTDYYKKEVLKGLQKLAIFVASHQPDPETKKAMIKRLETWTHRLAALQQGLKFMRFYAVKQ